jgi:hypothetical protein
MGMGTNLAFSFGWQKFKSMRMSDWHYLWGSGSKYTYLVIINTLLCCFCFIGAFLGKVVSAVTSVDAIHASPHNPSFTAVVYPAIFFPFKGATITATCKPSWKLVAVCLLISHLPFMYRSVLGRCICRRNLWNHHRRQCALVQICFCLRIIVCSGFLGFDCVFAAVLLSQWSR